MTRSLNWQCRPRIWSAVTVAFALINASVAPGFAQLASPPAAASQPMAMPQLQRLVAPIALYPDAVLTHIFMASTYPLEVVQAARWREGHPGVTGSALEEAMQDQPWDESVKALTAFPQVLTMMNEKLDWTEQLGEAFLAQEDDLFAAVQALRLRADAAGNLKTSKELRVSRAVDDRGANIVVIGPAEDNEIYVPVYDPIVVYGTWPYPDEPPYYWYPRDWKRDRVFWFGSAILVSAALWAVWDWRSRKIAINPKRFNAFNRTKLVTPVWAFNTQHRKGAPFKNKALVQKFSGGSPAAIVQGVNRQPLKSTGQPKIIAPVLPKAATSKTVQRQITVTKKFDATRPRVNKTVVHKAPAVVHKAPVVQPKTVQRQQAVAKKFTPARPIVKKVEPKKADPKKQP